MYQTGVTGKHAPKLKTSESEHMNELCPIIQYLLHLFSFMKVAYIGIDHFIK